MPHQYLNFNKLRYLNRKKYVRVVNVGKTCYVRCLPGYGMRGSDQINTPDSTAVWSLTCQAKGVNNLLVATQKTKGRSTFQLHGSFPTCIAVKCSVIQPHEMTSTTDPAVYPTVISKSLTDSNSNGVSKWDYKPPTAGWNTESPCDGTGDSHPSTQ